MALHCFQGLSTSWKMDKNFQWHRAWNIYTH